MPLVEARVLSSSHVIVDGKSGASGARSALHVRTSFWLRPQTISMHMLTAGGHRHAPEMEHQISKMGQEVSVTFVPHLLPTIRGRSHRVCLHIIIGI